MGLRTRNHTWKSGLMSTHLRYGISTSSGGRILVQPRRPVYNADRIHYYVASTSKLVGLRDPPTSTRDGALRGSPSTAVCPRFS